MRKLTSEYNTQKKKNRNRPQKSLRQQKNILKCLKHIVGTRIKTNIL